MTEQLKFLHIDQETGELTPRAHQVMAGVGYTIDKGTLPFYSRRAKLAQLYLGDTAHHKKTITAQLDKWSAPELPKGKPLGLWKDVPESGMTPEWFKDFA